MGKAQSLIKKLDKTLKKVLGNPPDLIYKRVVTRSGGDALTGNAVTVTTADTLLDPQPLIGQLKRRRNQYKNTEIENAAGSLKQSSDLTALLSPTSITADELESPNLVFVIKKVSTGENFTYELVYWDSVYLQGVDLFYKAVLRSVGR